MAPLFPHDLIRLQHEWIRTYEALARLTPTQGSTDLRRRLIDLSGVLAAHPYWAAPGCSPARRTELLRRARAV
ncbi:MULTISPECIES: hypothetical protein [unclassified Streptomyces]|uniref:hypothetical protein n=1 Tax=unclassified Streptomyces TaxID=2593676 RepID=UPI000DC790E1|nr:MULTISPECIES: hypothetical protein [unclassified Streptomyces]AWZ06857.1 hypothetical protein DRB89_22070 [Streptomyces sp. ICC4]AWZ14564.1 hypothetical protein DRB96_22460 [Streptomyces sp. ICC1]